MKDETREPGDITRRVEDLKCGDVFRFVYDDADTDSTHVWLRTEEVMASSRAAVGLAPTSIVGVFSELPLAHARVALLHNAAVTGDWT